MTLEQCPICGSELEIREVTPCFECGVLEDQVAMLREAIQTAFEHDSVNYGVYRIFDALEITLCDFCAIDIGSYDPEYFGLRKDDKLGFQDLHIARKLHEPSVGKDKYCPECNRRLAFINFLLQAREMNAS